MKYAEIIFIVVGIMSVVYYLLCFLQCFGFIKFTKKEDITFPKVLIPFYYFFR